MLLLIDCCIDNLLFIFQYAHKDDNNKFLIKKWNEDPPLPFTKVRNISNGMNYENEMKDMILLQKITTFNFSLTYI